eukprot:g577.t1
MSRDAAGYFACASLRQVASAAGGDGAIRIASVARVQRGGGGAWELPSLLVAAEPPRGSGASFSVAARAVEDAAAEAVTPSESAPSEIVRGCIWWVASEEAAPRDPPLGRFRTCHPYVVDFYHLRASIDSLDNVSNRSVDCVFTLEKATAHGDIILCAYPRWRSIASTIPTVKQCPSEDDGTVQLLPLSCKSASLTVTAGPIPMIVIGKVASVCVYTHFDGSFSLVTEIPTNSRGDRTVNHHMPVPRCLTLVAAAGSMVAFSQGSVLEIIDVSDSVNAWHCYFFNCTEQEGPQLLNMISFTRVVFEVDVAPHRPTFLRCLPRQLIVLENDALIIVPDAHPELAEEQNGHSREDVLSKKNFRVMHESRETSNGATDREWLNNKCGMNALLPSGSNLCDIELSHSEFELRGALQEQISLGKITTSDQNESKVNSNEMALVPEPVWLGLVISADSGEGINLNVRPSRTMIVFHANGIDKLVGSMEPFCSELELDAGASDA